MRELALLAVVTSLTLVNTALADTSAAAPGSGGVQFEIIGVGMGVFAKAAIATIPGGA